MKLSDLTSGSHAGVTSVYGVVVDEPSFVPPEGLKEIGVLVPLDSEGIDEIDVAISYSMAGVKTILEVPAEKKDVDAPYMVSTAANIGVSLSVLPPAGPDGFDAWVERVCDFARAYLKSGIYAKELLPVTSFMEYMFVEVFADTSEYAPKDPYVIDRFVKTMTLEQSDQMKAKLREVIYDHFGGADAFKSFAHAMASRLHVHIEEGVKKFKESQQTKPAEQ